MSALLSGIWPYLAAVAALLFGAWRMLANAKKSGILEQKATEAVAREEHLEKIKEANRVGDAVRDDPDSVYNDPHNRTRPKGNP